MRAAVSWGEALRTWIRIALLSFGGPAGQIAVMHRILVEEKRWISEERFLHALNYCMLLPGPEAQQLATYVGWLLHRTLGGIVAGALFVLPGFLSILALSLIYANYQHTGLLEGLFYGLKPAVLAIVVEAVLRIGKRVLKNGVMLALAAASFVALFFFAVPFPLVILTAGLVGFWGGRLYPGRFLVLQGHAAKAAGESFDEVPLHHAAPTWRRSLLVSCICLTLWFGPLLACRAALGPESIYVQEGLFFSKAAVMTFGGAYSVLAYVAQQAVERFGWLQPGEMLDGLGMAETTPGPLIQVVQFVGFLGAYRQPGPCSPVVAGLVGSVMTTWVTFVPCFFWIFLGAPYIEQLRGNRLLTAALSSITAAVVGVVFNLSVWFTLHTLFHDVAAQRLGPLRVLVPDLASIEWGACAVAILALLLTFRWKQSLARTLTLCTALGALYYWIKA
ncbi:MAG: chromate efflux transporter [Pirellulales bacterium]|nr:chromate efflux transporter [Pirellulales bacterium]